MATYQAAGGIRGDDEAARTSRASKAAKAAGGSSEAVGSDKVDGRYPKMTAAKRC